MQIETMLALRSALKKDYSEKNQLRQAELLRLILAINQDVAIYGISRLEDYENSTVIFPLLYRGLKLVRGGIEPQIIETILLNAALANDVDMLDGLLAIEGIISVQMLRSPDVTKELLLSYFSFELQDTLRERLLDSKLNFSEPLSREEIAVLLEKASE